MTDTTGTTREVRGDPAGLAMMLKAALPAVPGVNALPGVRKTGGALPDLTLTRHEVTVDPGHVTAYAAVCGFAHHSLPEVLPLTYPHVLAFGLHLAIMTDSSFPFPAVGTVHLANTITQHRRISSGERLSVTVQPADLRPHRKGQAFDMVSRVHAGDEPVWEEISTFLRRGHGSTDAPPEPSYDEVPPGPETWRLGADLGRRYAAVSGDHNPIHLHPLTAKAFGFPRHIAHGMWSMARCMAALENRLPQAVTAEVAFKKPILLPASVRLGVRPVPGRDLAQALSLTSAKSGAPHLLGRVHAA